MTDHPITPPPELVEEWANASARTYRENGTYAQHEFALATQAARWGADQELEACCAWVESEIGRREWGAELRAARRPKPLSLKEQALQAAQRFYAKGHANCTDEEVKDDFYTIRRALEALDE